MTAEPRPFASLSITPEVSGDEAWLRVSGAVDLITSSQLGDALQAAERDRPAVVGLEMSGLSFIDSSGVHLLIAANRRARVAGRRFVVAKPSYPVRRVLSITGLDRQIELLPDERRAGTRVSPASPSGPPTAAPAPSPAR